MQLGSLDQLVLFAYMAIVLGMGFYFSRRNVSTEEYFLGGRRFSGWVIGLSLVGTSISSITFIAYPGDAYKTSWLRFLPNLLLPLAVLIAAWLFLPRFREGRATSAYEFLEHRYGPSIRVYGALTFILAQLVRVSTILYLLGLLIQEVIGLEPVTAIWVAGVFVAVYTVVGGFDAVVWTDVMQTIVLLLGGLFCLYVIVDMLPGGLETIWNRAIVDNKLSFSELRDGELVPVGWGFSLSEKTASMMLLLGLSTWLTEYSSNQNTVQRFCAASSLQQARRGLLVCALSSLPIWAFYMFLGTSLYVFFQYNPTEISGQILDGTRKAEQILPYFITHYLPDGLMGLVIAAALAAAMSSLDSSINSVTTVAVSDIYRRHIRRDRSDRHYLLVAWTIAVVVSVFMVLGALQIMRADTRTLQDAATILVSLFGGGLLGLYLYGFLTRSGDSRAVWIGVVATMVFTAWSVLASRELLPAALQMPFDLYYTGIIANVLMFSVIALAAQLLPAARKDS
jgi:SSS family solute:Na+ symporter